MIPEVVGSSPIIHPTHALHLRVWYDIIMDKDYHWPGYAYEHLTLYETAGVSPEGVQKWKVVDKHMTWTTHELLGAMKSDLKSMPSDGIIEQPDTCNVPSGVV